MCTRSGLLCCGTGPDREEIDRCATYLAGETQILQPRLIIPVGGVAIEQVLGHRGPLVDIIATTQKVNFHGVDADAIALPHPSGASTWHRVEPGKTLLAQALARIARHPAFPRSIAELGAWGVTVLFDPDRLPNPDSDEPSGATFPWTDLHDHLRSLHAGLTKG